MRCDWLIDSGELAVALEWPPDICLLQARLAVLAEEHGRMFVDTSNQILLHPEQRTIGKEDDPLLVALADDFRFPVMKVDLFAVQRKQFADPHGAPEKSFDQRTKPQSRQVRLAFERFNFDR